MTDIKDSEVDTLAALVTRYDRLMNIAKSQKHPHAWVQSQLADSIAPGLIRYLDLFGYVDFQTHTFKCAGQNLPILFALRILTESKWRTALRLAFGGKGSRYLARVRIFGVKNMRVLYAGWGAKLVHPKEKKRWFKRKPKTPKVRPEFSYMNKEAVIKAAEGFKNEESRLKKILTEATSEMKATKRDDTKDGKSISVRNPTQRRTNEPFSGDGFSETDIEGLKKILDREKSDDDGK